MDIDLYYFYLTGWYKTLHRELPKFKGYATVQAHCVGYLDMKAGIKKTRKDFEIYLLQK